MRVSLRPRLHVSHTLDADWLAMFFGPEELFFEDQPRDRTEHVQR